jgi:hypothetical protein
LVGLCWPGPERVRTPYAEMRMLSESRIRSTAGRAAACRRRVGRAHAVHRRACAAMAIGAGERAEADLLACRRLACAAAAVWGAPRGPKPLPVRMRAGARGLLVDLPVDVAVVLDDQKRAGGGKQRPGAACKSGLDGRNEHVFDCRGRLGRNVGSTGPWSWLERKIRIVKRFLGAAECNGSCRPLRVRAWPTSVGQVVGSKSRNGVMR